MRAILDAILVFIQCESLTDDEFATIDLQNDSPAQDVYEALLAILVSRETVSDAPKRLLNFFLAKGQQVTEQSIAKSNIYIGDAL